MPVFYESNEHYFIVKCFENVTEDMLNKCTVQVHTIKQTQTQQKSTEVHVYIDENENIVQIVVNM